MVEQKFKPNWIDATKIMLILSMLSLTAEVFKSYPS